MRVRLLAPLLALAVGLLVVPGCATWEGARLFRSGTAALDAGDPARAIRDLEAAALLVPEASEVQNHLGLAYAAAGRDLDALAAYVTSLATPLPPVEAELVTGRLAFEDAGCEACHPAPLYTDSPTGVRHDVGTLLPSSGQRLGGVLDGIDTPTLLGVGHSGPWLHDGSAATLDEALAAHADGISTAALVQFLQSL